ncbi:ABC transporter ATP-binding protein [Niallia sp. 03133]|uniref:ABC transporter ATP-binding protein n=1 Tax=Niallia sp. 03133 TaxID=3458060 RepID=UPI00404410F7
MAEIKLINVSKKYKEDVVVDDLNVTIRDGSFTVLVGPSGCGKSTTLRMIAGLEQQSGGEIWIGNECVNDTPPGKRNIAMVFQNYALYPTMTVRGNIEFGLINKKIPKTEREQLIEEISEIVGLTEYLDKKPQQLSGGQRQRVALARAMVKKPKVFILDEPLSNLDAKLRGQMRTELIQLHEKLGTTFVYVTHDQVEAMSMGDEIIILNKGKIQQMDIPMKVYHDPNNIFTAEFIGTPAMNIFEYEKVMQRIPQVEKDVSFVGFRPEHAILHFSEKVEEINKLTLPSEILTMETLGAETIYTVKNFAGKMNIKSFQTPVEKGKKAIVSIPYEKLYFFDREGVRIRHASIKKASPAVIGGV